eukprot:TRINITY_DN14988_c1_g1_i1.p1 TRINITY_DN14988_c1_g1~~TRINITY_DN14988_c1_g1_i1.p1  ORF type:complete len:637 (+),score=235.61 TRINITY_DN14988_c1_g1_i1:174-1913(+)
MKGLFQPTPRPSNIPNAECISDNALKPRFVINDEKEARQPATDKWSTPACFSKPTKTAVQNHDLFWDVPDEVEEPKKEEPQKSSIELELEETKRQMEEYKQMMQQLAAGKQQMEEERKKMEAERQEIERLKAAAAEEHARQLSERQALESNMRQQEEEKRQLLEQEAQRAEELRLAKEREEREREEQEAEERRLEAERQQKAEQEAARIEQERLDEELRQQQLEAERLEQEQAKAQKERKRNEEREKRRKEKEEREQRQREAAEERKREEEAEAKRKLEMKKKREEERQKEKQRLEEEAKKKAEQRAAANQSKPKPVWESDSDEDMDFASLHAGMKSGKLKGKKAVLPLPKQSAARDAPQQRPPAKVLELKPKGTTSAWGSVAAVKKPLDMKKILAEELKKGAKNNEVESYLNPEKTKKKKQKYRQKVNHGSDDDGEPTARTEEKEEFVVPLGPQVDQEILEWATLKLKKLAGPKSTLDATAVCEILCLAGTADELRSSAADALGLMKGASRFVEDVVERRWPTGSKVQQLKQSVQQKQQPQPKKSQGKGRKAKNSLNNLVNFGVVAAPSFNAGEIETV